MRSASNSAVVFAMRNFLSFTGLRTKVAALFPGRDVQKSAGSIYWTTDCDQDCHEASGGPNHPPLLSCGRSPRRYRRVGRGSSARSRRGTPQYASQGCRQRSVVPSSLTITRNLTPGLRSAKMHLVASVGRSWGPIGDVSARVALRRQLRGFGAAHCLPQPVAPLCLLPLGCHLRMLGQALRRIGKWPLPWLEMRRFPFATEHAAQPAIRGRDALHHRQSGSCPSTGRGCESRALQHPSERRR
jgi:hypothetical protein